MKYIKPRAVDVKAMDVDNIRRANNAAVGIRQSSCNTDPLTRERHANTTQANPT